MSTLIPHVHDEIPADIMKAATDIAYSAETGVVVGSFPGAVYIARAILAERERCAETARDWREACTVGETMDHAVTRLISLIRGSA
ncbi:MAG: hypothetical protein E5V54_11335 [Mesorhizobium sp.]|nr:MAG: hypothetical protein E5V54_11335 [Mesorhizobium sp.]